MSEPFQGLGCWDLLSLELTCFLPSSPSSKPPGQTTITTMQRPTSVTAAISASLRQVAGMSLASQSEKCAMAALAAPGAAASGKMDFQKSIVIG